MEDRSSVEVPLTVLLEAHSTLSNLIAWIDSLSPRASRFARLAMCRSAHAALSTAIEAGKARRARADGGLGYTGFAHACPACRREHYGEFDHCDGCRAKMADAHFVPRFGKCECGTDPDVHGIAGNENGPPACVGCGIPLKLTDARLGR
jgi:hypothetical protein